MKNINKIFDYSSKLYDSYMNKVIEMFKYAKQIGDEKSCEHLQYLLNRLNSKQPAKSPPEK